MKTQANLYIAVRGYPCSKPDIAGLHADQNRILLEDMPSAYEGTAYLKSIATKSFRRCESIDDHQGRGDAMPIHYASEGD